MRIELFGIYILIYIYIYHIPHVIISNSSWNVVPQDIYILSYPHMCLLLITIHQGKFHHDLTVLPKPGIMVGKGNHPQMAARFRLVKYSLWIQTLSEKVLDPPNYSKLYPKHFLRRYGWIHRDYYWPRYMNCLRYRHRHQKKSPGHRAAREEAVLEQGVRTVSQV